MSEQDLFLDDQPATRRDVKSAITEAIAPLDTRLAGVEKEVQSLGVQVEGMRGEIQFVIEILQPHNETVKKHEGRIKELEVSVEDLQTNARMNAK